MESEKMSHMLHIAIFRAAMTTSSLSFAQWQQARLEQFCIYLVSELVIGIACYFYFLHHLQGPAKLKETNSPATV